MSSLTYYFDNFASEMLSKASKATNLLDLQEEMNFNIHHSEEDTQMRDMEESKGYEDQSEMLKRLTEELAQAFSGLFK
jgi:hypothetical protein